MQPEEVGIRITENGTYETAEAEPTCAEKLAELTAYIEEMSQASMPYGEVVSTDNGHATPVTWDMIGGQEEAKQEIREAIEYPHKHKRVWNHYKKRIPKGILLWGSPGCGKTLIGRALATSIGADFLFIKGPEILDPYVGVSESNLRSIMRQA